MGSDTSSGKSEQEELPHPPPELVEEVFSSMINSMPRTKLMDRCSDEDDDGEKKHTVHTRLYILVCTYSSESCTRGTR